MTFDQTRRDLIYVGTLNARTPCMKHRPFTLVNGLENLQAPAHPNQERRLRQIVSRTMQEMEAIKRANGKYDPAHCRVRPYRRTRA